jgi:3'(2'), 5'-bisphosphate nucleotidase / inositol polyphosphate 1-phosphatase
LNNVHGISATPWSECPGALSRGDAALFLRFPAPSYREKIWDHASGSIIVQEAGGAITDAGGAPLDFSNGR